jgi:hypothetical protein
LNQGSKDDDFFRYEVTLWLGGVAPEALAAGLARVVGKLGPLAELTLTGEHPSPPVPGSTTIDAARVARWLAGEAGRIEGGPKLYGGSAPFTVDDRGKPGRVLAAWFAQKPEREALVRYHEALTRLHARFRLQGTAHLDATVRDAGSGVCAVWTESVFAEVPYAIDAAAMRPAALNGLVKVGGVERVEWALGVEGGAGSAVGKGVAIKSWGK